jgi:hypothetical protein
MKMKFVAAMIVFPLTLFNLACGADLEVEPQFSHAIQFEIGAHGFSDGDQITITSVRGDRRHIEPGGSYLVEGSYMLASSDAARLALFCTTREKSGKTPIQPGQSVKITKGSGKFHLYETNLADGWLHVSFYPDHANSHNGGVYFGEKGREETILRAKWGGEITDKVVGQGTDNEANRALIAYLGDPVPPPTGMDARYNKENLLKAFTELCRSQNMVITKLAVDDTEFPFLVYGTLDGSHTLPGREVFEQQDGYTYGGSVRGSTGNGATYFAVNMVPSREYPDGVEKACHRRLMLRLEMLADKAQQDIDR